MNTKNVIIGAIAVIVLGFLGYFAIPHSAPVPPSGNSNAISATPWEGVGNVCKWYVGGTCNSGQFAASSTIFGVLNPWNATSTVSLDFVSGLGQSTSTQISVGTTTQATGLALANLSVDFVNAATIATTTQFAVIGGQTGGLGTSQISAGTSFAKAIVGQSEYVSAFATSTYGNAGAINYTPGLNCTYGITFTRVF